MRRFAFALGVLAAAGSCAQDAPAPIDPAVELGTIAVTGTQPGPGMWKVSKGDHVLWILGTSSPLPRDIRWQSRELEARVAGAQELLTHTTVYVKANTGFFGTLALLPSLIGVRNNPNHAKLSDVLPPELYARWSPLKSKYIGRSNKVESWRPIFAALELYEAALDRNRLTGTDHVRDSVLKTAKRLHVPVVTPKYELAIDQPRDAIHEFKTGALEDTECFRNMLDRIDGDLATMTARANAWATGDIAALRKLPQSDGMAACAAAVSESQVARERGITDLPQRVQKTWLDAANSALQRNVTTVAIVPMRYLLAADGYLSRLKSMGYSIEEPDDAEGEAAAAAWQEGSQPCQAAIDDSVRAPADPDRGVGVDAHDELGVVAHFAALADAIAARELALRFVLRDVGGNQAVCGTRSRILDDAGAGRERAHDQRVVRLRAAREHA